MCPLFIVILLMWNKPRLDFLFFSPALQERIPYLQEILSIQGSFWDLIMDCVLLPVLWKINGSGLLNSSLFCVMMMIISMYANVLQFIKHVHTVSARMK